MRAGLKVLALIALALASAGPAAADPREIEALVPSLPMPGTDFEDIRAFKLPVDNRLVCDTDQDKPVLAAPKLMAPQAGRTGGRVRRCSVFAAGPAQAWAQATLPTLAGPARLWLTYVEQGNGGRYRLAQVSLWAKRDSWTVVADRLSAILGEPLAGSDRFLSWEDEQHDTLMFIDEKQPDEFAVAVGDIRLRKLLKSPGSSVHPE